MKWRRKAIVEASQWFRHGDHPLVQPVASLPRAKARTIKFSQLNKFGWLNTPQGGHMISPGDWVIIDHKGQVSSCNPQTFDRLYEPLDPHLDHKKASGDAHQ